MLLLRSKVHWALFGYYALAAMHAITHDLQCSIFNEYPVPMVEAERSMHEPMRCMLLRQTPIALRVASVKAKGDKDVLGF